MNFIVSILLLSSALWHTAYCGTAFLTISDIHYGSQNRLQDGEDTGPDFLKTTLDKFNKLSQQSDFIIFLGDIPTHALFDSQLKGEYEKTVFHGLYANNSDAKPMFYVTGNNDPLEGNYKPFLQKGVSPLHFANDWDGACAHCDRLIIDGQHMYRDGYYSTYVMPGRKDIVLIALNTAQWAIPPLFLKYPEQQHDAEKQLAWLEQQVKQHHAQQLLIAMHIPPGKNYQGQPIWHQSYLDRFIQILDQHANQYKQISLLTSHSHMDELRKIHLRNGSNIYAYSTPGISRLHHNNPGMKRFSLDEKAQIKNFTTYYTSHLKQWKEQKYDASGHHGAIFPQCTTEILADCLDHLTMNQVCHNIDQGLFYGVKSHAVPNNACKKIYQI